VDLRPGGRRLRPPRRSVAARRYTAATKGFFLRSILPLDAQSGLGEGTVGVQTGGGRFCAAAGRRRRRGPRGLFLSIYSVVIYYQLHIVTGFARM
jgi:hypothetical protein